MIDPDDLKLFDQISKARRDMEQFWAEQKKKGGVDRFPTGIRDDLTPLMASLSVLVAVRKDTSAPSWVEIISRDLMKVATQADAARLERDLIALSGAVLAWLRANQRKGPYGDNLSISGESEV